MTSFVEKIIEVDARLTTAKIGHAFGGAICLGYHVESPRATVDIDLNVAADTGRAQAVLNALPGDVCWDKDDVRQIKRDGQARIFWDRTPIDLFFPQHELYDALLQRAEQVPFGPTTIPVLSATDLTIFKAVFDRPKDWVDIAEMLAYGNVDAAAVREWLTRLVGASDRRVARFDDLS